MSTTAKGYARGFPQKRRLLSANPARTGLGFAVEENFYSLWPSVVRRFSSRTLILILIRVCMNDASFAHLLFARASDCRIWFSHGLALTVWASARCSRFGYAPIISPQIHLL